MAINMKNCQENGCKLIFLCPRVRSHRTEWRNRLDKTNWASFHLQLDRGHLRGHDRKFPKMLEEKSRVISFFFSEGFCFGPGFLFRIASTGAKRRIRSKSFSSFKTCQGGAREPSSIFFFFLLSSLLFEVPCDKNFRRESSEEMGRKKISFKIYRVDKNDARERLC